MTPELTLTLPSFGTFFRDGDFAKLLELARMAEDAGVDRILLTDHVVMGAHLDRYPFGEFPFDSDVPWLEPLSCIAAMAAVTERIRFSTKVLIAPLRPAALLAKTLATMDVLSRGRIEVGVATGWQREELEAAGLDWSQRGALLTDTMAACRALWAESPGCYHGTTVSFDELWCEPKPVQPRLPIWFAGGLHPRNIARICELGDGWIPPAYGPLPVVRDGVAKLRPAWESAGRDPAALRVQGDFDALVGDGGRPDLARSLATSPEWIEAGATALNVVMTLFVGRFERAERFFRELESVWAAHGHA